MYLIVTLTEAQGSRLISSREFLQGSRRGYGGLQHTSSPQATHYLRDGDVSHGAAAALREGGGKRHLLLSGRAGAGHEVASQLAGGKHDCRRAAQEQTPANSTGARAAAVSASGQGPSSSTPSPAASAVAAMIPTASPLVFRVEWELVYSSPPPPPVAGPSDGSSRYSPTWQQQRDVAATTFALAVGWRADGVEYGIASDLRTTARGSIWAAPAAASTPTVQQIVFWPPGRVPAEIPAVFRLCVRGSSSSASSSASGLGSSSATAGGTVGPAPSLRVRLVVLRSGAVLVAAASRLFNATATASLVQRARGAPAAAAPQHDPCTTTSAGLIATFPWAPAPPPPPSHSVSGAAGGAPPSSAAARAYAASLAAALRGGYSAGAASAPSAPSPLPPPADLQLPSSAAGPDPTSHAGTAMNGGGGVEGVRARLNHSSRGDEAGVDRLVAAGGAAAAAEAAAAGQEEARARRVRVALCVLGPIAAVGVAAVAMALGMRLLRSRRPKAGVEAAGDGQQSAAATAVDQDAAAHPTAAATTLGGEDDIIIAGSHGGAAGPAADASAGTFSGDESA